MNAVFVFLFLSSIFYMLIQFARQEYIQEMYDEAILDIEGRLDWARSRSSCPFGMSAQIDVSSELLGQAKSLWAENRWQQAYQISLQSQQAIDRAQSIYSAALKSGRNS